MQPELPRFLTHPNSDIYTTGTYIVLDFETTNIDKGSPYDDGNSIILAAWSDGTKQTVRWANEYELYDLVEAIESVDFLIAHNAKFELGWLARCGLDLSKVLVYDTQIAEYVISGNRGWKVSLDACAERHGLGSKDDLIKILIKGGVCPSAMPKSVLEHYCVKDIDLTLELFKKQLVILQELKLLPVLYTRCLLTPVLADIEANGMYLDADRVQQVYNKAHGEYQQLARRMDIFTGGINPRSSKQVAEFLYDVLKFEELKNWRGEPIRTENGARKADVNTIASLKASTKIQKEFLALKKELGIKNAELTKALNNFMRCVEQEEIPIIKASFNQTITQTHRLSSNGKKYSVQFQNFPRKFKPLFTVRNKGWLFGEIDGAQLEFRVAAHLGRDEVARKDIENSFDVHSFTASVINNITEKEVTKDLRQDAKSDTFKPLYGGTRGTDAQMRYYEAFKQKYRGVAAAQDQWIKTVLRDKKLRMESGLIFYWPDTKMTRSGYITNSTNICNYPVQSFATADIIPIAIVYLWHYIKSLKLKTFIVNTIHDSALMEIHPDEQEIISQYGELSFTTNVYNYLRDVYSIDFTVPLEAEVELCSHWADSVNWQEEWLK